MSGIESIFKKLFKPQVSEVPYKREGVPGASFQSWPKKEQVEFFKKERIGPGKGKNIKEELMQSIQRLIGQFNFHQEDDILRTLVDQLRVDDDKEQIIEVERAFEGPEPRLTLTKTAPGIDEAFRQAVADVSPSEYNRALEKYGPSTRMVIYNLRTHKGYVPERLGKTEFEVA